MLNEISNKVIIDPSLFLAKRSFHTTIKHIKRYSESDFDFFISQTFFELIKNKKFDEKNKIMSYFLNGSTNESFSKIRETLLELHNKGFLNIYKEGDSFIGKYEDMYHNLIELGYLEDAIGRILFDEWVFIKQKSWLTSRIKKIPNKLVKAGAICLEFGERKIDKAKGNMSRIEYEIKEKIKKLKRFSDWIGFAGQILNLLINTNPDITNLINVVSDLFFLFDPKVKKIKELSFAHNI